MTRISIHAPLTGSDTQHPVYFELIPISIHAPLTGSDLGRPVCFLTPCDFNPRSPYGERLFRPFRLGIFFQFQSTLPLRGATITNIKH